MAMKVKAAILFLEEQRKRHEELYGIPASGIPGEENDDEDDLGEPQLIADTGDNSADGSDLADAAGSKLGDGQVAACRDPALTGEVHHYDHQDAEDSQDLKAALPTG